jgi:membrane-associated phospholipid phosphatase
VRVESGVSGKRVLPARVGAPLGVVSVVAAVVLVTLGILYAGESSGASVDVGIRSYLRSLDQPWHTIALVIDWTGEPVGAGVVLLTLVILFLRKGNSRAAVFAVAGPAVAVAVTSGMKPLVGRTINDGFLSYPSGHTATVTAFTLVVVFFVLGRREGRYWLLALPLLAAAAMAWAQVLLNAHYPTDTVGGFCAALAVVPAVAWVIDAVWDRAR